MILTRELVVKVHGRPITKGSMKCIGGRGDTRHQLIEEIKDKGHWRDAVTGAGRKLVQRYGGPFDGPLGVLATVTVECPKSVKPAERVWPYRGGTGDADKFMRLVLDAFTASGLYGDDVQVVDEQCIKAYPHSPTSDVLAQPGAFIRVFPIGV